MQLFLQLNLSKLPKELGRPYGDGLFQYFLCTVNDVDKECKPLIGKAFLGFAEDTLARIVHPNDGGRFVDPPDVGTNFPCKTITGWTKKADYPSLPAWEGLGLHRDFDGGGLHSLECPELGVAIDSLSKEEVHQIKCIQGDKLAGWPYWTQLVEYPSCPICHWYMNVMVFQMDSECNLPYRFGRGGVGPVTQCPQHKEVVAFTWSC